MSRVAGLLSLVLAVTGCASVATLDLDDAAWQVRRSDLEALQAWDLSGRVSVTRDGEGWHANLRWIQRDAGQYSISLVGPLGQGQVHIDGAPGGVVLLSGDDMLEAEDPDELVEQALGTPLPIRGLFYWIRGIPAPGAAELRGGEVAGRLGGLAQDGWSVEFLRYAEAGALELPARINARHGDIDVRLSVSEWRTP